MVAQEMMQCNNLYESRSEFVALVEDSAAREGRQDFRPAGFPRTTIPPIGRFARLFTAQITKMLRCTKKC